jgi:Protein of unknown function (DUF3037)
MPDESRNMLRYRILRYTPDLVRDEWVNIGVLLEEAPAAAKAGHPGQPARRVAIQVIEEDSEIARVRRLHPGADETLLRALPAEFDARLRATSAGIESYVGNLDSSLSNAVQLSPPRGLLAENFDAELARLFREHVAAPPPERGIGHNVRSWMRARIADAFQRRRIIGKLEHRVPIQEFTHPGDPLKLDYGYRYNATRGYLHAIALDRDVSQSKVFAYTAESIRQHLPNSIFTAVTNAEPSRENSRHQFIVQTLQGQDISIVPLSQIDQFADELRPRLQ